MFCPNCGTKNEDGALFCGSCGTNLQSGFVPADAPVAEAPAAEAPAAEAPVVETPIVETPAMDVADGETTILTQEEMETPVANQAFDNQTVQPQYNQEAYAQPQQPQYNQAAYGQPQQPQYNQAAYGQPQMQQRPPRAPFKPNKLLIACIVEALVAIIALVIFVNVGKSTYGYKNVANSYFKAVCSADWDTAYGMLDVQESTFINKDMFVTAMSQMAGTEINQSRILTATNDDMIAYVTMQYNSKSGSSVEEMKISLNKQKKRNFVFFNSWKVSPGEYLISNCVVKVPTGAALTMDGIDVPKDMMVNDGGYDTYTIPSLFKGRHKFQIAIGDLKGSPSYRDITYNDDSFYLDSIQLSEKQQKEAIDAAYASMTKIVENAVAGGSYESVKNLFTPEIQSDVEYNYKNYFEKRFYKIDGDYGITDVKVSNVKGSFESIYIEEGKVKVRVRIVYNNTNKGKKYDYWTKKHVNCEDTDNIEEDNYYMQYEDGQWIISTSSSLPYGVSNNSYFY